MIKYIPYGRQWVDEDDIKSVVDVLKSDWLTTGPKVAEFEQALAAKVGAKYAVAVSSGTAALHLACLAAGIGAGDIVVTSPITFLATANCALYVGARPDFVDIDPQTINMDAGKLEDYLKSCSPDKLPKAVIPVDFAGQSVDIEAIKDLANRYGFIIIEDACHALGASFTDSKGNNHFVGDCAFADITVLSFHPVKPITTGEGGALTTNSKKHYDKLLSLRNHGMAKEITKLENNDGPWYYEMQTLGYNYRLTDIQCALGISQLTKLDSFIKRRREIAEIYNQAFADIPEITIPYERSGYKSGYHLYVIQLSGGLGNLVARKHIFESLRDQGIGVQVHYIPIHLQPYYRDKFSYKQGNFPLAEKYYERAITLPIFPKMSSSMTTSAVKTVKDIMNKYMA